MGARCVDAECVYACDDGAAPEALLSDAAHCGGCDTACESGAPNSVGDACVDAQCTCMLPTRDGPVAGVICDGRCEFTGWENCAGGCCPTLRPGDNPVRADTATAFTFDMPSTDTARIFTDFPRGGSTSYLFRYEDDGSAPVVEAWFATTQPRTIPVLPMGHYVLVVYSSSEPGVVTFERSRTATDFTAPGAQIRDASAEAVHATFRAPQDREYTVLFAAGPDGNRCAGEGVILVVDDSGAPVAELARLAECRGRFSARWTGRLVAGRYTVRGIAEDLWGDWQISVE